MKTRDTILSMMNVKKYMINSVTGKYYGITNMRINVRTYLDTSTLTISRKQVVTIARICKKLCDHTNKVVECGHKYEVGAVVVSLSPK